jgi:hypothetical protein
MIGNDLVKEAILEEENKGVIIKIIDQ